MKRLYNNQGSILVMTLILIPLFLVLAGVGTAGLLSLRQQAQDLHSCRITLLQLHLELAKKLNFLLEMNPQATELRLERAEAEKMVEANLENPPGLVAAQAELVAVITKQRAFHLRQTALIREAEMSADTELYGVHRQIQQLHEKTAVLFRERANFGRDLRFGEIPKVKLNVKAVPPISDSPDYEPVPYFELKQTLQLNWQSHPVAHLPEWLPLLKGDSNLTIQSQCAATLTKGGSEWTARLAEVNPLSNW